MATFEVHRYTGREVQKTRAVELCWLAGYIALKVAYRVGQRLIYVWPNGPES